MTMKTLLEEVQLPPPYVPAMVFHHCFSFHFVSVVAHINIVYGIPSSLLRIYLNQVGHSIKCAHVMGQKEFLNIHKSPRSPVSGDHDFVSSYHTVARKIQLPYLLAKIQRRLYDYCAIQTTTQLQVTQSPLQLANRLYGYGKYVYFVLLSSYSSKCHKQRHFINAFA